jgi:hypothetical protein
VPLIVTLTIRERAVLDGHAFAERATNTAATEGVNAISGTMSSI